MTFPDSKYTEIEDFSKDYFTNYKNATDNIDWKSLKLASNTIEKTYINNRKLFVCGNGGSAAIANHLICDHGKLIGTDTKIRVQAFSLSNSIEIISAIANDISYNEIFSFQLNNLGNKGDTLLTISGSGNSLNIIKAIEKAKTLGMSTISFTGFDGGKSSKLSDINIHISSKNYGIVEDAHQALMQIISQFLRMKYMDASLVKERIF